MDVFLKSTDNFDLHKRRPWTGSVNAEHQIQEFNNGITVTGRFSEGGLTGRAQVKFPEGSVLVGEFTDSRLESAQITYSCGPRVAARYAQLQDSNEVFMSQFSIVFPSGFSVEGESSEDGLISTACVYDRGRSLLAEYTGALQELREGRSDTFLIVSSMWVYEGKIGSKRDEVSRQPQFLGPGVQIWNRGVGYYSFEVVGEVVRKSILRYNRNLELYRQAIYRGPVFEKSVTFYGNGLMFHTGSDYFNGDLVFILNDNRLVSFRTKLDEYWYLRAGFLLLDLDDPDKRISFKKKDRRLLFTVEGQELDLSQFKERLATVKPR